jgi:hypothetical protein
MDTDIISDYEVIYTLEGNDIIQADNSSGPFGIDFFNVYLDTYVGNDSLIGRGLSVGIQLSNSSVYTGDGNDKVIGESTSTSWVGGFAGLLILSSWLSTGGGKDSILGTSHSYVGLLNIDSNIDTGADNDVITGSGLGTGSLDEGSAGIINNSLSQYSIINTGDGNDVITGTSRNYWGIWNTAGSQILTGAGNDVIRASSESHLAVRNDGLIDMGGGNDVFDAFSGGFQMAVGKLDLGSGSDTLLGFGSGPGDGVNSGFYGGSGNGDKLILPSGEYTVYIDGGKTTFEGVDALGNTSSMDTYEFERLVVGSTSFAFSSLTNNQTIDA